MVIVTSVQAVSSLSSVLILKPAGTSVVHHFIERLVLEALANLHLRAFSIRLTHLRIPLPAVASTTTVPLLCGVGFDVRSLTEFTRLLLPAVER